MVLVLTTSCGGRSGGGITYVDQFYAAYGVCNDYVSFAVVFEVEGLDHNAVGGSSACEAHQQIFFPDGSELEVSYDGRRTVSLDFSNAPPQAFDTRDGNVICVSGTNQRDLRYSQLTVNVDRLGDRSHDDVDRLIYQESVQSELARLKDR